MKFGQFAWLVLSVFTVPVGYAIHHSYFWTFIDFLVPFLAWLKWLVFQQVSLSVIRDAYAFFLR